jgi:hypothetical protein
MTADVDGLAVVVGNLRLLSAACGGQPLPAEVLAADAGWRARGALTRHELTISNPLMIRVVHEMFHGQPVMINGC